MKTKIALSLLLSLALLLSSVGTAVASPVASAALDSGKKPFAATAQVAVIDPGTVDPPKPLGQNLILQHTAGEKVAGQIVSSAKWPEIKGKNLLIVHESNVVLNLQTQRFTGKAIGTVVLLDGTTPLMQGTYEAVLRGRFAIEGGVIKKYDNVFDVLRWDLNGIPGTSFAGASATGLALATLKWTEVAPGVFTLAGPMGMIGRHW